MGLSLLGLLGWAFIGALPALMLVLFGCALLYAYHLRNVAKLVRWTREPIGSPLPRAFGLWDLVFADLARRSRMAYDQRERLAQALTRFREASQAMPDGVVYLSAHNMIDWVNLSAERHFGLDHERDIGQAVTNLVRQPDFVRYLEAGNYREPLVFKPLRQDGTTLSIQIVPFGEDQKMILSHDVTQLERLETMRRDFVANVSHELKTPLTVVSGFLEMLIDAREELPPPEQERYLRLALEQAGRMQRLINDLLALSALETGAPSAVEDRVDALGLIRSVRQEAELLSGGRHRILVEGQAQATLIGCQKELHSAFANLAVNAVRYTPDGGQIILEWHLLADGGAEFAVRDTGIGIEAQHIPRLTERFYRVDRGRSRETGGTGLGLAIVKHVLTRHQAHLDVHSEPGHGSRFAVQLPARRVVKPGA